MTFRPQYIPSYRYKSESLWCWCSLHSHHKYDLHCCIHRYLEVNVMSKRKLNRKKKNGQKKNWAQILLSCHLTITLSLSKYCACNKKNGSYISLFYEQFVAQMLKLFLTLDRSINLSFLTTAVARGTEVYSYAVISQFFEL